MLGPVGDLDFSAGRLPAYGSTEQPAIADRMTPYLRMTQAGAVVALLGVVAAVVGMLRYPSFAGSGSDGAWMATVVTSAVLMLLLCAGQVLLWRRAYASWRGLRPSSLRTQTRLSWVLHLVSYPVALAALLGGMAASAATGWTTSAAVWLTLAMVLVIVAQVFGAVQYLRPDGPPGTIPAHMRRLAAWTAEKRRADDD